MRSTPFPRLPLFGLLALAVCLGCVRLVYSFRSAAALECAAGYQAGPRRIVQRLHLAGAVSARRHAQVAPSSAGIVERVHVRRGDHVRGGQLLVSLASDDLDLELKRRELAVLKVTQERPGGGEGYADDNDIQTQIRRTERELAMAERDAIRRRLDRRHLRAPFDGRVLQIPVTEGQLMSPGGGGIYVVDLNSLFVEIEGDEYELTEVRQGMRGTAMLEGMKATPLNVRVSSTPALKRVRTGTGTPAIFSIEADFEAQVSANLQPGLTAQVELTVKDFVPAVTVPLSLVTFRGRQPNVTVCSESRPPEERTVSLGIRDAQHAEVAAGLKSGEFVIRRRPD